MGKREEVVRQAQLMVGTIAWSAAHEQLINDYNAIVPLPQGFRMSMELPWCATFVSVMAKRANALDLIPAECSCPRMITQFQSKGRWVEDDGYAPKPGDIIFYDWDDNGAGDCMGTADHVGIIEDSNGESFTVIEGNISASVGRRFLPVNAQYIRGFGVPAYDDTMPQSPEVTLDEPVIDNANTYTVQPGDSPWKIAQNVFGDGSRYKDLYKINGWKQDHVIHPGEIILISTAASSNNSPTDKELRDYLEAQVQMLGGRIIWSD